ncbi:YeeE/YedE family protein [Sinorhizobium sp. BG8]|uniref:YeeE/YedE family protein n=1 Tax=Sinorhizobium sp. BG8 TaxID=2613773 RepID=UPI00193C92FB|nr:YeeE/YedE family protein [Sinorhizobium sp. BG8]QRM53217.1 YeeE/YedE family protein [Sinorhizobium sp. BG8]
MTEHRNRIITALVSGIVFGFGLSLSGMLDPARVQGFLDVFGNWDPSLAFVLFGAVLVAFAGVRIMRGLKHPAFDDMFHLPTSKRIDARLVIGSTIFGMGWGLGGFCPGPAIASLSLGLPGPLIFVAAMLVGISVHDRGAKRIF